MKIAKRPIARYVATMLFWIFVYTVLLIVSLKLLQAGATSPWKYLIAVLPVFPALGIPIAVMRFCQAMDELQLRIQLESLAFGFALAAVATFTYGFLQNAGLPDVGWVWVWPVMAACWIFGQLVARRRYR